MKKDRATIVLVAFCVTFVPLMCITILVRTVVLIESQYNTYPFISQETIETTKEMDSDWDMFESSCKNDDKEGLYDAVMRRNSLNARIQWGQIKSLFLGVTWHTNSEWICGTDQSLTINTYLGPPGCKGE